MTVERNQIGWAIWLMWVLMTTMGWALGFLIGFVLGEIIGDVLGDWLVPLFFGIGLGIGIGVLQWLLLTFSLRLIDTLTAGGSFPPLLIDLVNKFSYVLSLQFISAKKIMMQCRSIH